MIGTQKTVNKWTINFVIVYWTINNLKLFTTTYIYQQIEIFVAYPLIGFKWNNSVEFNFLISNFIKNYYALFDFNKCEDQEKTYVDH